MTTTETGTGMTAAGGATINPYEEIGLQFKLMVMVGVQVLGVDLHGDQVQRAQLLF